MNNYCVTFGCQLSVFRRTAVSGYVKRRHQMTRQLIFIFSILTLFTFCGQTEKKVNYILNKDKLNLDGYWILTNYIDKITETKSIEPQVRQLRLTWDAIIFKIDNDTIETHGLIMANKYPISNNLDSLTSLNAGGKYKLTYSNIDNTIVAQDHSGSDSVTYKFRKINQDEHGLVKNIDGNPFFEQLEQNFCDYFIDIIFSGTYRPLTKTKSVLKMNLLPNETVNGFKSFDSYSIHDYFGTLHPFSGDAIIFTDSKKEIKENQPPDDSETFKWEFRNDTLILTEYLTEDFENYNLGKKQYTFIKE